MRTAAYASYSTEMQSVASIDDQLRNIRTHCVAQGWAEPVVYSDAAMSGSRNDRPGYLRLLAEADRYDVILVDDLSRLSRDSVEVSQALRRLQFRGVRVLGVSDNIDTSAKGHKINASLRGIMGELYLDDLRDKTHRGLAGRALSGASAGGLAFGYAVTGVGQRAIDEAQAEVVRRIFADYIAGSSARDIAAALNREGVPAARRSEWSASAIFGDVRRGIGILANPIYVGRQVWNRSRWIKHPESGHRVRRERPESEWITTEHPELAIVDAATWAAAQRRVRGQHRDSGNRGRPAKNLLSGILRCGGCGSPMVAVDKYNYGCARHKERSTCPAPAKAPRKASEDALLAGVREILMSDEHFARHQRMVAAQLRAAVPAADQAKRQLAAAEKVRDNVMAAIRVGIITPSTKAELERVESEIASLSSQIASSRTPAQMVPRLRERWNKAVEALTDCSKRKPAAREALQEMLGGRVTVRNENGEPVAEIAVQGSLINVVAGAGSVLNLQEPVFVALTRQSKRAS